MDKQIIKICNKFVRDVLKKESWYIQLVKEKSCDLVIFKESAVKRDNLSDIDIFLICKYKAQIKHSLKPIRTYNYKGNMFEVSILSTEKLFNSQYNKEDIHWWNPSYIIISYNKLAKKALYRASHLTKKEFLDRLWTNFVYFEINSQDIEKQIIRKDPFSVKLLFNENIKLVIDSEFICKEKFPSWKQTGSVLKKVDKEFYKEIIRMQNLNNIKELQNYNRKLRFRIISILRIKGFSDEEINNWDKHNLERVTFQYR